MEGIHLDSLRYPTSLPSWASPPPKSVPQLSPISSLTALGSPSGPRLGEAMGKGGTVMGREKAGPRSSITAAPGLPVGIAWLAAAARRAEAGTRW